MTKSLSSREAIKMLKGDGWELDSVTGDHHHFVHPTKRGKVTVPHPRKDIPLATLKSIFHQAGFDWRNRR